MAIGSINASFGNSYGAYNQKLTQETYKKLVELGISFNPNITEQEGRALIKKAENAHNNNANQNNMQNQTSSQQDDLFEQALKLAERLGIEANKNTGFDELISKIESTLEDKIQANKNDVNALNYLKDLSQELSMIQAQSEQSAVGHNTNQALMDSLELLSQYNKNFLYNY